MVSACSTQNRVNTWAALDGVTGPGVIRLVTTFEPVIASTTGNLVRAAPTPNGIVKVTACQGICPCAAGQRQPWDSGAAGVDSMQEVFEIQIALIDALQYEDSLV
ncbi:hypothetical protein D3C78_1275530 [compost metagenome]